MLVVIEGVDCSGKDTLADTLHQVFGGARINFPDESVASGRIARQYLKGEWCVCDVDGMRINGGVSAFALQAVMLFNRAEMLPAITRWRANGDPVFAVRWWQSGIVYGGMDGLDVEALRRSQLFLPQADLNIYLDIAPDVAMARRARRDGAKAPELYESRIEKIAVARQLYRNIWAHEGADPSQANRWVVIDGEQTESVVLAEALKAMVCAGFSPTRSPR